MGGSWKPIPNIRLKIIRLTTIRNSLKFEFSTKPEAKHEHMVLITTISEPIFEFSKHVDTFLELESGIFKIRVLKPFSCPRKVLNIY